MSFVGIVAMFGFILFLSFGVNSVNADNSWNVLMSPHEGLEKNELFMPLEIPISSGDTVTWVNQDSTVHRITSGVPAHPAYSGEFFVSGDLSPGESFSETFDNDQFTGFYYFCEIHPWFTGKVFFEDRDGIYHSTLDISYDVIDSNILHVNGLVESDLGTTGYEILIFDSKNSLIFQKLSSFESDASFEISIDTSSSIWDHDENYLLKLVYGVPSESTELSLHVPLDDIDSDLKLNSLEFCDDSESDFIFLNTVVPSWFSQTLCWFGNDLVVEKEIYDSVYFFQIST